MLGQESITPIYRGRGLRQHKILGDKYLEARDEELATLAEVF